MILEALKYIRSQGKPKEWTIEDRNGGLVRFANVNLIVGRNGTGKSRTLDIIREISELLSLKKKITDLPYKDNYYHLVFDDADQKYEYELKIENDLIVDEKITLNGVCRLDRKTKKIYSEKLGRDIELLTDVNSEVLIIEKHTDPDFPYLDKYFMWGSSLYKANFTNQIEKKKLAKSIEDLNDINGQAFYNPKDVLTMFYSGKQLFGKNFTNKIINDMQILDYPILGIDISQSKNGFGICVREEDINGDTNQLEMSQGMFRALAFIIQLTYGLLNEASQCILIDDLGEGLDFDRSKALINLISDKIENSDIQVIFTTNDRYIMNAVPLKYWSIIERKPQKSIFYNYFNSKKIFDDFEYTGLSNFDILNTHFYIAGFEDVQ